MSNKQTFTKLRKAFEEYDKKREALIALSRNILKTSKKAIYSAHRGNLKEAQELLEKAKKKIKEAKKIAKKDEHLLTSGAYSDSLEEYVEASCYIAYLKNRELPKPEDLGVDHHTYLPGLCDLVGELVRAAINSAAKGDHKTALEIKRDVEDLYSELMLFDWRNTPVRRKFDSIKYGLEKLEDLALKIAFKQ
ncbi:hypothetical protein D6825_04060 [Candidatus Woesearchaeota archaeon]|nr:MAG: hypothetical protein D6825_04060 [Candidatus Woesearchaeota archaeon]